jgi:hypothetical protein
MVWPLKWGEVLAVRLAVIKGSPGIFIALYPGYRERLVYRFGLVGLFFALPIGDEPPKLSPSYEELKPMIGMKNVPIGLFMTDLNEVSRLEPLYNWLSREGQTTKPGPHPYRL